MEFDKDRLIEKLRREIEKAREKEHDFEETRTAMLYMLEDLNESTEMLEHAKKDWELTFDSIPDPLFLHDRDFRIIRANRAYMECAGMGYKSLIGMPYYKIFPKTEKPSDLCLKALESGKMLEEELSFNNRVFRVRYYPILDSHGRFLHTLHILEDITERVRLVSDLKDLYIGTITTLSEVIDAKSNWTRGHSERVTGYALIIGKAMGMPEQEIDDLRIAGLLHDIGKVGTYDYLLDKKGQLSDEEYLIIQAHPKYSARLLSPIRQLRHIISWVRHHHERWDGKGYPDGLKEEEIPLGAKIICVADAFDAMTSDRPYRKALGKEKAIEELRRCGGIQFDPRIVDLFIRGLNLL